MHLGLFSDRSTHELEAARNRHLLGATYIFYYGLLGVFVPYVGIYLNDRGMSSAQIGSILAIVSLARMLGPNLWANYADKSQQGGELLRVGCLLSFLSFISVLFVDSFWGMTLAFSVMMLFWTAVLPQLEVITTHASSKSKGGYGAVRLWGSIGFIICTFVVGVLLDYFDSIVIVYSAMASLAGLFVCALLVVSKNASASAVNDVKELEQLGGRDEQSVNTLDKGPMFEQASATNLWSLGFVLFLLGNTLLQVSFGSFYNFFTLYMQSLQYSGMQTGVFICLGVAAEVAIFIYAARLIKRFGVKALMIFSILFTALRWLMLALFAEYTSIIVLTQLIHALSFGLTHAASVFYLQMQFPKAFQSRVQALYISIAFGFGSAAGSYLSGLTWNEGDGAQLSFILAALCALLAAFAFIFLPKKTKIEQVS